MTATICAVLLAGSVIALAWAFQRSLIYFPFGEVPSPASVGLPQAEQVRIPTADGLNLGAWFLPGTRQTAWTVLVFNGNGGHRALRAPLAAALVDRGMSVLLFDYRGYGGNEGSPSESGLAADALAARAWLDGREGVAKDRIVYFGESLGSGVAARLAVERPPFALILRSPFTSLADVGRVHYPWLPVRWLLRDRFLSLERVSQVRCPVLVIAGRQDSIVPLEQSRRVYDGAPQPKDWLEIEGADHNDSELLDGPRMITAIDSFLRSAAR